MLNEQPATIKYLNVLKLKVNFNPLEINMKQLILLLTFLVFYVSNLYSQNIKKVLFIGNSYTSTNNLPQMIKDISNSMGDSLIFDDNTPGGSFLVNHLNDLSTLNKIMAGDWDYVVLQDQSLMYSGTTWNNPPRVEVAMKLNDTIKKYNSCSQTIFYITWGRKNGSNFYSQGPPYFDFPFGSNSIDYFQMDSTIENNYMISADSTNAIVSPVGAVWRSIRQNNSTIELFNPDESHPSIYGSYAAACSFYTTIFRKDPSLITFNSSLPEFEANFIKNTVKSIVFDSLLKWHIGEFDSLLNPNCLDLKLIEKQNEFNFNIYPNPTNEKLNIITNDDVYINKIIINDCFGKSVYKKDFINETTISLDLSHLMKGTYFIQIYSGDQFKVEKLIISE